MVGSTLSVYQGKKVLVTGHTGFKGAWLSLWLRELGAEVIGLSLEPSTHPSLFEALCLASKITSLTGDIRDLRTLKDCLDIHRPNFIFHLAARPLVVDSYQNPLLTYETNVMGTANLLETVRSVKVRAVVVIVTSDKCYDNGEHLNGYKETDPLGGYDPYSSSKACAELVTAAYRNSFFPPDRFEEHQVACSSVRAGNCIGGGDWSPYRIIPDCVRALAGNESIKMRDPHSIRPWQFVLEPLRGYLELAEKLSERPEIFSGAWNFGPRLNEIARVDEIVSKVIRHWGGGSAEEVSKEEKEKFQEAKSLLLDSTKADERLGWEAVMELDQTIAVTVDWYKRFYQDPEQEMYSYSCGQLNGYLECLLLSRQTSK